MMDYRLPNLATLYSFQIAELSTSAVQSELSAVAIPMITAFPNPRYHEVFAERVGILEFQGGLVFGFQRAPHYYAVNGTRPLPYDQSTLLNRKWRNKIRIEGYGDGKAEAPKDGVRKWHVDTLSGLAALYASLYNFFGGPNEYICRSVEELEKLGVIRAVSSHPFSHNPKLI